MKSEKRSPGNGRPLHIFAAAVAVMVIAGCSTGSRSLDDVNTLDPLEAATTTTIVTTTTAPLPTISTVIPSTSPIPTTTLPATPSTILATTTLVPPPPSAPTTTVATVPTTTPPTAPQTIPPASTAPPQTAPPTTKPTAGCTACKPDYVFTYGSHFTVPQLGTEPVRGTGCGADGSLGETMPDGIWDGHVKISEQSLTIDVQCVYYGDSAAPFVAACEQQNGTDDDCAGHSDFFIVNNNPRKRTVPLDPGFRRRFENADCADPGPGNGASSNNGAEAMDSWLIIENGKATFALTSCVYE